MNCEQAKNSWNTCTLRPDDLPDDELAALQDHLQHCPDCQAEFEDDQRWDQSLALAMQDVPVPAGLTDRLKLALVTEPSLAPSVPAKPSRRRWWVAATASCVVLLVGLIAVWSLQRPPVTVLDGLAAGQLPWNELQPVTTPVWVASGWREQPGMTLAPTRSAAVTTKSGRTLEVFVTPFRWTSRRPNRTVEGRLLQMTAQTLVAVPTATTFAAAPVEYHGQDAFASWIEGDRVFVCYIPNGVGVIEQMQQALSNLSIVS